MIIAFFADAHLGNHRRFGGAFDSGLNDRCQMTLKVLNRAVAEAGHHDAVLVSLGDLFDSTNPEPQLIAQTQQALGHRETYVLLGNHEMESTARGDHALGPLHQYGQIEVIDQPRVLDLNGVVELVMVPFQPGPAVDWLPETLERMAVSFGDAKLRVLCLHLGLIDENTPPWLLGAHDAVPVKLVDDLCAKYVIGHVVSGNWHSRQRWGNVMQVGTLCPTGFDNPGLEGYGTLALFNTNTGKLDHVEIPGPRFLKLRPGQQLAGSNFGNTIYVQAAAGEGERQSTDAQLAGQKSRGQIAAYEVVADEVDVETAARSAAFSARSSETFDEALAAFVREMPMEDGTSRDAVLEHARRYIKNA